MRCIQPQYRYIDGVRVYYNCGRCEACLRNKRNEKALRGYLESLSHSDNAYLTLTYSDDNLTRNEQGIPSLRRKDYDDFVKRLRTSFYPKRIKVLGCGEYSPTGRPHFHLCLFGCSCDDILKHCCHYHKNSSGIVIEDLKMWNNGGCEVAPFDIATAFYISKYLLKGKRQAEEYKALGVEPEFVSQSRRPGLGYNYAVQHRDRLLKDGFIRCKGKKFRIPRYFIDVILDDGSDEFQSFKDRICEHSNTVNGRYIKQLKEQFKGSGKHLYQMMAEEGNFREQILRKEK